MFLKIRNTKKNRNDKNHRVNKSQNAEIGKLEYFENIAMTNNMIDLEKELQNYNELLI